MIFGNTAETPETAKYQKRLRRTARETLAPSNPPPVSARDLPLGVWAYNRYLALSWALQGCTRGEPYSENTAEQSYRNAFGNFN
jgi:hypothetical protein